jgi:hypothetical protein
MAEFTTPGAPLRVSLLRMHDCCPQAAKWATEGFQDFTTDEAALGTVFHAVAEEMLKALRASGMPNIPTQEGIEIGYEVLARPDMPHLSSEGMEELRWLILGFCKHPWPAERIMSLERRLFASIPCQDGVTRTLTGQPDVLIACPPDGAEIIDYKSGRTKPPAPRDGDFTKDNGRPYLSERGAFQLDSYGFLVLNTYPQMQWVRLRECFLRIGEEREATLYRADLEHVHRRLAIHLERLDKTLTGEVKPEARPGTHCKPQCPRISDCPIRSEERREGAIGDDDVALEYALRYCSIDGLRERDNEAIKAYIAATKKNIDLPGGGYVGWRYDAKGRRSFGVHHLPSAPQAGEEQDTVALMEASLAAQKARAAR